MSSRPPRRHDEILGARVVVTGWEPARAEEVTDLVREITGDETGAIEAPVTVLEKATREKAERIAALLVRAGATVEVEDAWTTRDAPREESRPACPFCGSEKTQPYTHAGPAARKTMKCTTCGKTFRVQRG